MEPAPQVKSARGDMLDSGFNRREIALGYLGGKIILVLGGCTVKCRIVAMNRFQTLQIFDLGRLVVGRTYDGFDNIVRFVVAPMKLVFDKPPYAPRIRPRLWRAGIVCTKHHVRGKIRSKDIGKLAPHAALVPL